MPRKPRTPEDLEATSRHLDELIAGAKRLQQEIAAHLTKLRRNDEAGRADTKDGQSVVKAKSDADAVREQTRQAKASFDAAHVKGMKALKSGDYRAFDEAIASESAAVAAVPANVTATGAMKKTKA